MFRFIRKTGTGMLPISQVMSSVASLLPSFSRQVQCQRNVSLNLTATQNFLSTSQPRKR